MKELYLEKMRKEAEKRDIEEYRQWIQDINNLTRFHELNGEITEISYECKSTEAVAVSKPMAGVFEVETSPVEDRSRGRGRGRGRGWQRKSSTSPSEDTGKFISKIIRDTKGGIDHQLAVCSFEKGSQDDEDKSGKKQSRLIPRPLVLKEKYNGSK